MAKNFGLVLVRSRHSVEETVQRLQVPFMGKCMLVFAVSYHSGEAE